jgi:hypothetical protein
MVFSCGGHGPRFFFIDHHAIVFMGHSQGAQSGLTPCYEVLHTVCHGMFVGYQMVICQGGAFAVHFEMEVRFSRAFCKVFG